MSRMPFTHRASRRSVLLGIIGFLWCLYGYAVCSAPPGTRRFGPQPAPFDALLTTRWAAAVWGLCGLIGLVAAFRARQDSRGFAALVIPPLGWAGLYAWSWVTAKATDSEFGSDRAWVNALVWAAVSVFVVVTAGWPDTPARDDPGKVG